MRSRILLISYLVLSLTFIFITETNALPLSSRLDEANKLYRENDYDKAIEIYQSIVDDGYFGISLFYNLGNAYYRIGKIGRAILYYEKALKIDPSDEDVIHNLNFTQLSTVDRIQPLPRFFLFDWWEALLGSFSSNGWAYLVFAFYLLMIILIGVYFFARSVKQQKIFFFSGISMLFILALTISMLVVKVNREATLISGVIIEQVVTVKSSPDPQSTDSFIIHEGLKVNLEDNLDNWVKIRLADGKVGWIENYLVEQI
ncbi:tetratricopeptide repeat protein [Bacteroidota bacterium]